MEAVTLPIITEFINGVGFPIAVCIALLWNNHQNARNQVEILKEFKQVLHENTEALKLLTEKVGNK